MNTKGVMVRVGSVYHLDPDPYQKDVRDGVSPKCWVISACGMVAVWNQTVPRGLQWDAWNLWKPSTQKWLDEVGYTLCEKCYF